MDISPGFTLIGENVDPAADWGDAPPGSVFQVDQDLYQELDEPWQPGERVGWLHGTATLGGRDQVVCHFVFSFANDPEDSIVAAGLLPREGKDTGGGVLAVTGGTGRFAGADGAVHVESRNPKRYAL